MAKHWKYLYIYATNRSDPGMKYAVGGMPDPLVSPGERANGSLAHFETAEDAQLFAYAYQDAHGAMVHVLPSAEVV